MEIFHVAVQLRNDGFILRFHTEQDAMACAHSIEHAVGFYCVRVERCLGKQNEDLTYPKSTVIYEKKSVIGPIVYFRE